MTAPRPVVLDASVALKWVFDDEQDVEQAVALRDDFLVRGSVQLFAPTLYVYELVNGIISAMARRRLDRSRGELALGRLLIVEVALRPPSVERTFEMAVDFGLSAYDGSYVALAEHLGAELWTADRQLYDAVGKRLPWVRWIADYAA